MNLDWDFWAKLFFLLGFVWWAMKWTARNLRAQIGPTMSDRKDLTGLSAHSVESIVTRGLATRAQLLSMSAKEQRLLFMAASTLGTRAAVEPEAEAPRTHCPNCGLLVENWPTHMPWRTECVGCRSALIVRRAGPRVVVSFDPPGEGTRDGDPDHPDRAPTMVT